MDGLLTLAVVVAACCILVAILGASLMGDEVKDANTIRTWRAGSRWYAEIGPRDLGLVADGPTAPAAILALAVRCDALGWTFDESWKPR